MLAGAENSVALMAAGKRGGGSCHRTASGEAPGYESFHRLASETQRSCGGSESAGVSFSGGESEATAINFSWRSKI